MATNEKDLTKKIEDELKKYNTLKSAFLKMFDAETDLKKKRTEAYIEINKIEERDNIILSDIYKEFNVRMNDLENIRKRHLDKLQNKLLPVTAFYPEKIKIFKKRMNDLISLRKAKAKNEQDKIKQQKENNVDQVQSKTNLINQQTFQEKKEGESLEKDLCQFESERVNDNKCLFLHFIHSELEYHAAALETMSSLFNNINNLDPLDKIEDFIKMYNLKIEPSDLNTILKDLDDMRKKNLKGNAGKVNQTNKVFGDNSVNINNSQSQMKKNNNNKSNLDNSNIAKSNIGGEYIGSKSNESKYEP